MAASRIMRNLFRHILILVLGLVTCLAAGCQMSQRRSSSQDAPDVFHYAGNPPVLIFIPLASLRPEDNRGYPAQIALPAQRDFTTNRIGMTARGEVVSPGVVRLRSGSTVLEAIGSAGGFAPCAHKKRLRVSKSSGEPVTLFFHSRRTASARFGLVWCDTSQEDSLGVAVSDYVLEAGDEIHVPSAVF